MLGLRGINREQLDKNADKIKTLSYNEVGESMKMNTPDGYWKNSQTTKVGEGIEIFEKLKQEIIRYNHLKLDWIQVLSEPDTLEKDGKILMGVRIMGILVSNITTIINIIDKEDEHSKTFGFVYGTTLKHMMKGEEIFLITLDKVTEDVKYTIHSYSKPNHLLSRISLPLVRRIQIKFRKQSTEKMRQKIQL